MKKTWSEANVEMLGVKETAFGPFNKEHPDSEKTAIFDEGGNLLGWMQEFGEASSAR